MKSHHSKFQAFKAILQVLAAVLFLTCIIFIAFQLGGGAAGFIGG